MSEPVVEAEETTANATPVAIGEGARFEGLLAFWGTARIEGLLQGEVAAEGTLEVGPQARVQARVEVDALVVEGLVEGEVIARDRIDVRAGGRVTASVRTPRLVLAEGGSLEGRIEMTKPGSTAAKAASAA